MADCDDGVRPGVGVCGFFYYYSDGSRAVSANAQLEAKDDGFFESRAEQIPSNELCALPRDRLNTEQFPGGFHAAMSVGTTLWYGQWFSWGWPWLFRADSAAGRLIPLPGSRPGH